MRKVKLSNDYYQDLMDEYHSMGSSMIWSMKDGTDILIRFMEDSHVKNCINMLKRNALTETRRAWLDIFTDVQLKRRALKLEKIKKNLENGNNGIYNI